MLKFAGGATAGVVFVATTLMSASAGAATGAATTHQQNSTVETYQTVNVPSDVQLTLSDGVT
jgi:hypothetical protein